MRAMGGPAASRTASESVTVSMRGSSPSARWSASRKSRPAFT